MEKVVRIFHSHEEAELADLQERARMTPQQRTDIFFAIRERSHPTNALTQRFAPVYRVLELERS